jgi:hypothetical protein
MEYIDFLKSKLVVTNPVGFEARPLNPSLRKVISNRLYGTVQSLRLRTGSWIYFKAVVKCLIE